MAEVTRTPFRVSMAGTYPAPSPVRLGHGGTIERVGSAPDGRSSEAAGSDASEGEAVTGGPAAARELLRHAEDTAVEIRQRGERESVRIRGDAVAEAARRLEHAAEVAESLSAHGDRLAKTIIDGAATRAAESDDRVARLEEAGDAASALAERTATEAAAEAGRHRRQSDDAADAVRREARESAQSLRRDLLAEAEAETATLRSRAQADAAAIRRPAERLHREAEQRCDEARRARIDATLHAREVARSALDASPDAPSSDVAGARRAGKERPWRWAAKTVVAVLVLVTAVVLVRTYVAEPFAIAGASMVPVLEDGDRVVVNKLAYRLHPPERGDVVVISGDERGSDEALAKRVIGLPGETVELLADGRILVDGRVVAEPYLGDDGFGAVPFTSADVADGHVFVLGDNRRESLDSRSFGSVAVEDVVGRVEIVVWPPSALGTV